METLLLTRKIYYWSLVRLASVLLSRLSGVGRYWCWNIITAYVTFSDVIADILAIAGEITGKPRRMSVLGNLAFPEKFFYNIYEILFRLTWERSTTYNIRTSWRCGKGLFVIYQKVRKSVQYDASTFSRVILLAKSSIRGLDCEVRGLSCNRYDQTDFWHPSSHR